MGWACMCFARLWFECEPQVLRRNPVTDIQRQRLWEVGRSGKSTSFQRLPGKGLFYHPSGPVGAVSVTKETGSKLMSGTPVCTTIFSCFSDPYSGF